MHPPSSFQARQPAKIILHLAALFIGTLLLTACGQPKAESGAPSHGKKKIVTTFTIIADMAREVAGSAAEVESLTKPGAEIHEYDPTPRDLVKAQNADLILWNGLELERWFEKFFEKINAVPSVVLTDGIEPIGISEGPYGGKPNPHAWMSISNGVIYVENIRKALVKLDPANAAVYNANAADYTRRLEALDGPIRRTLAEIPDGQRWLATSEGAFSYLCKDYGLRQLYLWPINADATGTPQQIQKVVDAVRAHHVPVVFSESTVSDKPAREVARETGARYGGVLYVDSLTKPGGAAPTYLKLLETNANTIVRGFTHE